jgi:hypothetical protein
VASSNTLYSAEGYGSPATSCNFVDGSAKTVWYELEGDGSCLSASVVGEGFQPLLALYDGDDCDLIFCEAQTSYGNGYGYDGTRGLLSWRTQNGAAYKLVVAGERYRFNSGDFVLAVTVRSDFVIRLLQITLDLQLLNSFVAPFCRVQVSDDCPDAPENDECETALGVSTFPFTATGSTLLASPLNIGGYYGNQTGYGGNDDEYYDDDDAGYGGGYGYNETVPPYSGCSFLDLSSKSVWYLVEGDGSCMTASVTSRTFDVSVSVIRGTECDEFTCVSASENYYSSNGASWQTVIGESYYVIVGGRYRSAGDFFLDIQVRDAVCEFG